MPAGKINNLAKQLSQAYASYKKHPCLKNQSTLMDRLDEFVSHFESLEDLMRADVINANF